MFPPAMAIVTSFQYLRPDTRKNSAFICGSGTVAPHAQRMRLRDRAMRHVAHVHATGFDGYSDTPRYP